MSSLVSPRGRDSRPDRASARRDLEVLESRALLSTTTTSNLLGAPTTPATPTGLPTILNLKSVASLAEAGQPIPLVASVAPGGNAKQLKASIGQTISGTIEIYTVTPRHTRLGSIAINKGASNSNNPFLSALSSSFGVNQVGSGSFNDTAFLTTKKLQTVGQTEVQAKFIPSNSTYRASTSDIKLLTITAKTQNAPTSTTLIAPTSNIEAGAAISFSVNVHNADSNLTSGHVQLVTVGSHPIVLGRTSIGLFDRPVGFATSKLRVGTYEVEAVYTSGTNRFASSTSAPVMITVTPLTAVSFRVKPFRPYGYMGQPQSFTVTALGANGKALPTYTGTVGFSSPTDSWTILPLNIYQKLQIAQPVNNAPWLATFSPGVYTFTPVDHGTHRFDGAVTFNKGGMNSLVVTQANDPEVTGSTIIATAPRTQPKKGHTGYYPPYGVIDLRKQKS